MNIIKQYIWIIIALLASNMYGQCILLDGPNFNVTIKRINNRTAGYYEADGWLKSIEFVTNSSTTGTFVFSDKTSPVKAYGVYDNTAKKLTIYTEENEFIAPQDFHGAFSNLLALETIENLPSVNTENVMNMEQMFAGTKLSTIDFSRFDTRNVTNMNAMFRGSKNIQDLDVRGFDTRKVTDMCEMFKSCEKLRTLMTGYDFVINGAKTTSMFSSTASTSKSCNITCTLDTQSKMKKSGTDLTSSYFTWTILPELKNLTDGVEYTKADNEGNVIINYTRTFTSTNWQALYVPFSMKYDDWKDYMDVYDIYNVLAYDEDNNGEIERTTVNMIRLKEGAVTEPNYPYVVRAKNAGDVEITLTDGTLYAAENNSIDCTSTKQKFTFTGTYEPMTGLYTKGCYALDGGVLKTAIDDAVTLKPQRWYMEVANRDGSPAAATRVYLNPFGEENEVEGVKGVAVNIIGEETTYDLNGRTVNAAQLPKGLYVRGGKKIIVK